MITYRRISTKDPQYILEKDLRNRVLRLPLGLGLSEQDMRGEDRQKHIVALNSKGEVIGCVLVAFQGQIARIRQFAVEESTGAGGSAGFGEGRDFGFSFHIPHSTFEMYFPNTKQQLFPPKAKEFERATYTAFSIE